MITKNEKIRLAKYMRYNQTPTELMVDEELGWLKRNGRNKPVMHYLKQFIKRGYILDFFFPRSNLAVEIDGGYHDNEQQREKDVLRDQHLALAGVKTIRFTDEEVRANAIVVADKIQKEAKARYKKRGGRRGRKKQKDGHLTRMTPGRGPKIIRV